VRENRPATDNSKEGKVPSTGIESRKEDDWKENRPFSVLFMLKSETCGAPSETRMGWRGREVERGQGAVTSGANGSLTAEIRTNTDR
jgi:hypothetical protein